MSCTIQQTPFGKTETGQSIDCFTLADSAGCQVKIITYGGRITELHVPDKKGDCANIVLGYGDLQGYLGPNPYFGATIGRVGNRIAGGSFALDGVEYRLPKNDGSNTLHGGVKGFDCEVWTAQALHSAHQAVLRLRYVSPDGEQGFPGNLATAVTFSLNEKAGAGSELRIEYVAVTDKPTPVNLTNHSYFNLAGAGNGTILDHLLTIRAEAYTPVDDRLIPTGQILAVQGTPMDFNQPRAIGARIERVKGGYDHNYVLSPNEQDALRFAASAREPKSGRSMEVFTTQPGVQLYTGNFLDGSKGLGGAYVKHGALCLETQHFPDSVHYANFPSTIVRPGQTYRQEAVYQFTAG